MGCSKHYEQQNLIPPDIAEGVNIGKDDMDVGAGGQGIMFGYTLDETNYHVPLTHLLANKLGKVAH